MLRRHLLIGHAALVLVAALALAIPAAGGEVLRLAAPNAATLAPEDVQRSRLGEPYRFALPADVNLDPAQAGIWEDLADGRRRWRLAIESPGCLSLCLGFSSYRLPWGATLEVADGHGVQPPLVYTAADNRAHGQLWTPVLLTDALAVSLTVPRGRTADFELRLARVGLGYRYFGEPARGKSGVCNIDVVCPEGDDWRQEIRSVGVFQLAGVWKCTGAMVNNTAEDGKPYFLTANHCAVSEANAASVVVYWNYESPTCGAHGGGSLADFQSGATWRAGYPASDFTLIELDQAPDPEHRVTYAGWDVAGAVPAAAVTIHHPETDEKSISFENDPLTVTTYLGTASPGDGTHLRIADWDLGTTEPGSSGSPLFDPAHHLVGQLHGGYAACGNQLSDWYGRLSASWVGGGTPATRLRDWLDPAGTAATVLGLLDPSQVDLTVGPATDMEATGDPGGPFTPASWIYTLSNHSGQALEYAVTADVDWVEVADDAGTIATGADRDVSIALAPAAALLTIGVHRATVTFTNVTAGVDRAQRSLVLEVGDRTARFTFGLDTDPGWTRDLPWAFGSPQGLGGDPAAGHTGASVLGTALDGAYPADLTSPVNLTAGPFDCRGMSGTRLRFWRWLGVEAPAYDHAAIEVRAGAGVYTTIWANPAEVLDTQWVQVTYDISAVADGAAAVTIRWSLGPTDSSLEYCGWNLDDIEILGFQEPTPPAPGALALLGLVPNPGGTAQDVLRVRAEAAGPLRVTIYDLLGRRIAELNAEAAVAGVVDVPWDGRDLDGARVPSGVYAARLQAQGKTDTATLTIVR